MKNLRTHSKIRTKNLDLYLFLKLSFDNGKTIEEIKKEYLNSLNSITKDEKDIKLKMERLYNTYYLHFRNRELQNKGIKDFTTVKTIDNEQLELFENLK